MTTTFATCTLALASAAAALADGGDYVISGGTAAERAEVVTALDASSFNWDLVPARIAIHVAPATETHAVPGEIWIDARLLDTGRFAWGIVQHEYAHQVDFFLFDPATEHKLNASCTASIGTASAVRTAYAASSASPRRLPGRTGPRRKAR